MDYPDYICGPDFNGDCWKTEILREKIMNTIEIRLTNDMGRNEDIFTGTFDEALEQIAEYPDYSAPATAEEAAETLVDIDTDSREMSDLVACDYRVWINGKLK
jgi:hypothetical protein